MKPSSEIGLKNPSLDIEKIKIQETNSPPSQPERSYQECLREFRGCDKEGKAGVILKSINYIKKQPIQNIFSYKQDPGLQAAYYTNIFLPFIIQDFPHTWIL